jgi:hypothetical protein
VPPGKKYTPLDFALMAWRRRWVIISPFRSKPHKGLFVVSIELVQRSVGVESDCTLVEAA